MIPFNRDDINRKYSPTWVYCNDNSKAKKYRKQFIEQFGGTFIPINRHTFKWEEDKKPEAIRRKFIFEDKDGIVYITDNMYDFCKKNDLTRAAMYETISGKRKQHKGFKFIAEIPWSKTP